MVCKVAKALLLSAVLCGLSSAAHANTTAAVTPAALPGTPARIAQNDIALPPAEPTESIPMPQVAPSPSAPSGVPPGGTTRIALLLPLRSPTLGPAAEAVRAGFLAAYQREPGGVAFTVAATDGSPADVLAGYGNAAAQNDIVIGPLARSEVTMVAQQGAITKPTIALAQPDTVGDADAVLPPHMLAIGLSTEEEARQAAHWIGADKMIRKGFVVSTQVAWQRRAARAFVTQWRALGQEAQAMELAVSDGYLTPGSLVQLKKRIQAERPEFLFAALDAGQAAQLRLGIGSEVPLYGTSQLNPLAQPDWEFAEPMPDMEGVRLLDMPWQLQPDHPAVMSYPRMAMPEGQRRSADLERLYALGIDAYRVAREIALGGKRFTIDGVTGKLEVEFGHGAARFERTEQPAAYQNGKVVPLDDPH